jgi:hypothetical protein
MVPSQSIICTLVKSALAPTVVSVLKLDNDQLNYMAAPQRKAATKQSSAPE